MKTLLITVAALLGVVLLADWMSNSDVRWLESQKRENREAIIQNKGVLKNAPKETLLVLEDGGVIVSLASPYRDGRVFVRHCRRPRELSQLQLLFNKDFSEIREVVTPDDPNYAVALEQFKRCEQ